MPEALTKAGRYQIHRELGRGSMGVVYEGFDPVIDRVVAIKTMLPAGLSPQEFEEYKRRFQREAKAAGVLAHPNIITVYDFGEDNGVLYLAMEYLDGKSLERLVQEQTVLPIETIVPIYDQICSALDHAHQNHIVHRDIKPANIMILSSGLVKVTDFGIAKMMAKDMTQAGQILGTPNYMSPEQVKGRQIDGRSDIFSLGVILYELVTGEKPFGGQNITTVIYKIINENPIPPRELDASIHAGLSSVISKALAKNPDERYQTCRALAEDLRNYKTMAPSPTAHGTMFLSAPAAVEYHEPAAPPPQTAATQAVPAALDETPIASTLHAENVPYGALPPTHRQPMSQIVWVVAAVLLLAIMAGVYVVVSRPGKRLATTPASPAAAKTAVTQNPQPEIIPVPPPAVPAPITPVGKVPAIAKAPATALPPAVESVPVIARHERTLHAGAKVGQLSVSSNINGAAIFVDGRSDPSWVTPYTIADLPVGVHNISISRDGYDSFRQSVVIEAGKTLTVQGNLSTPTGDLGIVTKPAGLEVLIDGKSYGPSPISVTLPPGKHNFSVKEPGGQLFESSVDLRSGGVLTRTITIGAAAATGVVEVRTIPSGATVNADGALVGGQTPTSFRLPVGAHTLVISESGYPPIRRQVNVTADGTATVNANLTSQ